MVKCTYRNIRKDFDGKFALFLMFQRAGGWCEPVRQGFAI